MKKIYNQSKTEELSEADIDLTKGYLKNDSLFIAYHEAIPAVEEIGHYKTLAEYPNGGKDVEWVVDTPAASAREAYDEYEDILVYIPYTSKELAVFEISELKSKLCETDYKAIKYAEGLLTAEEYAEAKEQRQAWRNRINELEEVCK